MKCLESRGGYVHKDQLKSVHVLVYVCFICLFPTLKNI